MREVPPDNRVDNNMSNIVNNIPQSLSSLGKHEHQIPQVEVSSTLHNYFQQRQRCIDIVKLSVSNENTLQLPEPVVMLLAQLSSKPDILRKIEKRFVIANDIAAKTLPQLHQLNNQQQLWVKVQVAQALLEEFNQRADVNSLNSAVRLTDSICLGLGQHPLSADVQQSITALIETEQLSIRRLQHEQN